MVNIGLTLLALAGTSIAAPAGRRSEVGLTARSFPDTEAIHSLRAMGKRSMHDIQLASEQPSKRSFPDTEAIKKLRAMGKRS